MTAPELARLYDRTRAPRHYGLPLRSPRARLESPGLSIAVVGGDGAGKSTAVEAMATWLGSTFVVHRTHLGKPRPSLLTLAVKGPMYVARWAGWLPSTRRSVDPATATAADFPGAWWALWHLLTARDRLRAYRSLIRRTDAGGIVVSDRWPLAQLHLMDGSKVGWILDQPTRSSRLVRRLASAERRCYEQIGPPDVIVVLRLDPETAVARRPQDDPDYVRRRNAEVRDVDWSQTHAMVVDASRPKDEVHAEIRSAVRDRL